MKNFFLNLGLLLIATLISCKGTELVAELTAETGEVTELGAISAKVNGVANLGDDPATYSLPIYRIGVEYSLSESFNPNYRVQVDGSKVANKSFCVTLAALLPNTKYYYHTYISVSSGGVKDYFGQTKSFVTGEMTPQDSCVDLGLPSKTLWATMNIGAHTSIDYGDLFAWGEPSPRQAPFDWNTYSLCDGYDEQKHLPILTKYCLNSDCGTVDGKSTLDKEDDAAFVLWGPEWRIPSTSQINELKQYCTWVWTSINNINGWLVTSNINENAVFFPAAGKSEKHKNVNYRNGGNLSGFYWSRNLVKEYSGSAQTLYLYEGRAVMIGDEYRCYGLSIRPVRTRPIQVQQ